MKINIDPAYVEKIKAFKSPDGEEPFKFQKVGAAFLISKKYALLGDEMGLGKTVQALIAAEIQQLSRVLIICPKSVAYGWQHEIFKWLGNKKVDMAISKKDKLTNAQYTVLPWSQVATQRPRMLEKWDAVIIDEAHYAKNPNAKRTIAVLGRCVPDKRRRKEVRPIVSGSRRIWCLTGTPVPNRPIEIQPVLSRLGCEFASDYNKFGNRYCRQYNQWAACGYDYKGARRVEELNKNMHRTVLLRRLRRDVVDQLPAITRQIIPMETRGDKELEAVVAKQRDVIDTRGPALRETIGRGWAPDLEEIAELRHEEALAKVMAVTAYVQEQLELVDDKKMVVFAYHRDVIEALHQRFEEVGIDAMFAHGGHSAKRRQQMINDFKDAPARVFIASIPACGTGMNGLQHAASHCVFAELVWTPGELEQAEGRVDRIGQTEPVLSQYLVSRGGLDAYMMKTILDKTKTLEEILD